MEDGMQRTRWDSANHRAQPGEEQATLEGLELKTGHYWERTAEGAIKLYRLERSCQGPLCAICGLAFCVDCGIPRRLEPCEGLPAAGPVEVPAAKIDSQNLTRASIGVISGSYRD